MKLNKYQVVVLTWGITMFLGYFLSDLWITKPAYYLAAWTILIAIALFVQTYLMWLPEIKFKIIHIAWILICLAGGLLTYLFLYGYVDIRMNPHTFWLGICAIGMFITAAALRHNITYHFLGMLYLIPAVFFQINKNYIENELIIVGLIFLVVEVIDALFEYSSLRSNLADFEGERVL